MQSPIVEAASALDAPRILIRHRAGAGCSWLLGVGIEVDLPLLPF
jgi:hypothetical protein